MSAKQKGCIPAEDATPITTITDPDSTAFDPLLKWFSLAKNALQRRAWVRAYNREEKRMRRVRHE
ncbi:MAG: hypothetical protein LBU53_10690 [Zoogloeaceae bacterium]|jgi:hypothetical protein|nr:hypothetical protein [Zoogloeaceae bacterium]